MLILLLLVLMAQLTLGANHSMELLGINKKQVQHYTLILQLEFRLIMCLILVLEVDTHFSLQTKCVFFVVVMQTRVNLVLILKLYGILIELCSRLNLRISETRTFKWSSVASTTPCFWLMDMCGRLVTIKRDRSVMVRLKLNLDQFKSSNLVK